MAPLWSKLERALGAEPDITSLERRLRLLEGKLMAALPARDRALFLQYESLLNERQELALAKALQVGNAPTPARESSARENAARPQPARKHPESTRRPVAKKSSNDG